MIFIPEKIWDLLPEIPSSDRDKLLRLSDSLVFPDILEFEGHPGPLSGHLLPDPDSLPALLVLHVSFYLLLGEEDRVPEGLEGREGVFVDDDLFDRRFPDVAGILVRLVEDDFHAGFEFLEDGGRLDEDGFSFCKEALHVMFGHGERDAGDLGHRSGLLSGPLEDELVVLLRDLPHGVAEVAAPHRLVRDECEIPDQRLELKGFRKDADRF